MTSRSTLDKVLADEALRQEESPAVREKVYLAHAAVSLLPARVARAITEYTALATERGQFEFLHREVETETRALMAALLGAKPDEIAFVPSTSAGLSMVAAGLEWSEGDSVVVSDGDFPANIYPWVALRRRGVEVKFIPRVPIGVITLADVDRPLDARTRLVSHSSVHFSTGAPLDVDAVGAHLRDRGVLFCLDAIQSPDGIVVSLRENLDHKLCLRVSPHFYNTEGEIDALLARL